MAWKKVGTLSGSGGFRARLVIASSDGTFSQALPANFFSQPPVVTATAEAAAGRDYVVTLTSTSAAAISGRCRRSKTLPAVIGLLSTLAGFDTFEAAPVGTIVHLNAQASS